MAPERTAYVRRAIEPVLERALVEFPVVTLSGPRQSGKTTFLRHRFGRRFGYVSLEPPDVRQSAAADPRGFLAAYPPPVIFDEVQHAPDLLPYIKERVDADRSRPGQYVLTGSQDLLMNRRVSESLAGRTAILRLLPLANAELLGDPGRALPWERAAGEAPPAPEPAHGGLWAAFLRGFFPEPATHPERDLGLWYQAYIQTYLERDVRGLRRLGELTEFQRFLQALAARSAQLLNVAGLGRDLGIAANTVKAWLSVLEATHQVIVLRPWFVSAGKRLVKTPKVYFADVGLLCHLAGLRDARHAAAGPMGGAILETAVVAEVVKRLRHRGRDPRVSFWRTAAGAEVDLVVEADGRAVPVEVKLSATPRPAMGRHVRAFLADYPDQADRGYVVHPGDVRLPLGEGVEAVPFGAL